jgi:hypothetical protein
MKDSLAAAGVLDVIGREHLFPTVHAAVDAGAGSGGGS